MEKVVRLRSPLERTSASLPRKPMRVGLLVYMVMISVSLNFPFAARVTLREASEWPLLPSAKECIYGGPVKDETRNPQGGVSRSRTTPSRRAQNRPEAGTRPDNR